MTKIEKKFGIEGGDHSWFIVTGDFSSLEARLAAIDTCLNNDGIDPILFEVYKDGSKTSDLHSMTGFATFCKSVDMQAIHVHDDVDNKDYVFAAQSKMIVDRGGQRTTIFAKDLKSTDHILEYLKK